MIRYLQHKDIDFQKWDECIRHSECPLVYGYSWWLNVVCPEWEALVMDDYAAVMPLTKRRKFGFSYLYQPDFTQQLGVFAKEDYTITEFLQSIPGKFRLVEIQLNEKNHLEDASGYTVFHKKTHHLSLHNKIEEIRKNYSENTRRNLNKFGKSGFTVKETESDTEIIDLFRKNKGRSVENLGEKEYGLLSELLRESRKRQIVTALHCRNESDQTIAGAIFIHSDNSYIFLFSATGNEAREKGAMPAIIDRFIELHAGENKILDFEGSMIPELARFYRSFGSVEIVYLQIRRNTLLPLLRRFK